MGEVTPALNMYLLGPRDTIEVALKSAILKLDLRVKRRAVLQKILLMQILIFMCSLNLNPQLRNLIFNLFWPEDHRSDLNFHHSIGSRCAAIFDPHLEQILICRWWSKSYYSKPAPGQD